MACHRTVSVRADPTEPYPREGQGTGALRFGDHRAIAPAGALCLTLHAVTGFTNRSLRALVAGLLGVDYTARQMTYACAASASTD